MTTRQDQPILAEDLLLLLFQPRTGTIAGDNMLYYVLSGAVLAELSLLGSVTATTTRSGSVTVEAVQGRRPSDEILCSAWVYVYDRRRDVQSVLAAVGPTLRQPILDRLIARGDIGERYSRLLGVLAMTALVDGGSGRRSGLLGEVRDALVGDTETTLRGASLAALIWGSGTLPQFDPDIPWTSSVIALARELSRGNWGATAAGDAVTRTSTAMIINNVIVAANLVPPQ